MNATARRNRLTAKKTTDPFGSEQHREAVDDLTHLLPLGKRRRGEKNLKNVTSNPQYNREFLTSQRWPDRPVELAATGVDLN